MADIDPTARPDQLARCPRRTLSADGRGPRCLSLVLVRDADEHERWHDQLDGLLDHALYGQEEAGVTVADWPRADEAEPAPADGSHL